MTSRKSDPLLAPVFEALLLAIPPVGPRGPATLRKRVLDRVEREMAQARLVTTIPASDEGWMELLPKIRGKMIYTDGTAESWLFRLEAGAHAPAHDHPATEECLVLEGSIRYLDGSTLHAGDYEVLQEGAHHSELVSDTGALIFLRYAKPLNQYIAL
jgi:anti-sigma factor ChrR (cupin superfamily)